MLKRPNFCAVGTLGVQDFNQSMSKKYDLQKQLKTRQFRLNPAKTKMHVISLLEATYENDSSGASISILKYYELGKNQKVVGAFFEFFRESDLSKENLINTLKRSKEMEDTPWDLRILYGIQGKKNNVSWATIVKYLKVFWFHRNQKEIQFDKSLEEIDDYSFELILWSLLQGILIEVKPKNKGENISFVRIPVNNTIEDLKVYSPHPYQFNGLYRLYRFSSKRASVITRKWLKIEGAYVEDQSFKVYFYREAQNEPKSIEEIELEGTFHAVSEEGEVKGYELRFFSNKQTLQETGEESFFFAGSFSRAVGSPFDEDKEDYVIRGAGVRRIENQLVDSPFDMLRLEEEQSTLGINPLKSLVGKFESFDQIVLTELYSGTNETPKKLIERLMVLHLALQKARTSIKFQNQTRLYFSFIQECELSLFVNSWLSLLGRAQFYKLAEIFSANYSTKEFHKVAEDSGQDKRKLIELIIDRAEWVSVTVNPDRQFSNDPDSVEDYNIHYILFEHRLAEHGLIMHRFKLSENGDRILTQYEGEIKMFRDHLFVEMSHIKSSSDQQAQVGGAISRDYDEIYNKFMWADARFLNNGFDLNAGIEFLSSSIVSPKNKNGVLTGRYNHALREVFIRKELVLKMPDSSFLTASEFASIAPIKAFDYNLNSGFKEGLDLKLMLNHSPHSLLSFRKDNESYFVRKNLAVKQIWGEYADEQNNTRTKRAFHIIVFHITKLEDVVLSIWSNLFVDTTGKVVYHKIERDGRQSKYTGWTEHSATGRNKDNILSVHLKRVSFHREGKEEVPDPNGSRKIRFTFHLKDQYPTLIDGEEKLCDMPTKIEQDAYLGVSLDTDEDGFPCSSFAILLSHEILLSYIESEAKVPFDLKHPFREKAIGQERSELLVSVLSPLLYKHLYCTYRDTVEHYTKHRTSRDGHLSQLNENTFLELMVRTMGNFQLRF